VLIANTLLWYGRKTSAILVSGSKMEPFQIALIVVLCLALTGPVLYGLFLLGVFLFAGLMAGWAVIEHFLGR